MSAFRAAKQACKAMKPECRPILTDPQISMSCRAAGALKRSLQSYAVGAQLDETNAVGIASGFHVSSFDGAFCFHAGSVET